MRRTAIPRLLTALFVFVFGHACATYAASRQLSSTEANDLRQTTLAIIGPYHETKELGLPLEVDESIGFGAALVAWKNDKGDVRAVVGAPSLIGDTGGVYVLQRMHGTTAWHQQLIAVGEKPTDRFGAAVAVDGDTLAIGAPGHDNAGSKGAAYVYVYDSSSDKWTQQGTTLIGANAYGTSVALSGDTLAISAPEFGAGSVGVYVRSAGAWAFSAAVTPPDSPPFAGFGSSLALDGQHLLVGAPADSSIAHQTKRGSAYMFELDATDGRYTFQQKLIAGLDGAAYDNFGTSVALSGNIAVIGLPGRLNNQGAVNSFRFDGSAWILQPTLYATGGAVSDRFGWSVAARAGALAVGAPEVGATQGNLYAYDGGPCSASTPCPWMPTNGVSRGGELSDWLGTAVAIEGNSLFVGAPQYNLSSAGYVQALSFDGHRWNADQRIEPFSRNNDLFGLTIATSGNRAIVAGASQAILYERDANDHWVSQATFESNGCTPVAVDGDTAVVGLANAKVGTNYGQGTASIYVKDGGGVWSKQQDVSDPLGSAGDRFGCAVGISGNTIAIGAPGPNARKGSAYIFTRIGTSWTMQARLSAGDGADDDFFGYSLAISGNVVAVGAPDHATEAGAVYVFTRSGSTWSQRKELTGEVVGDEFGSRLALSGDTIAIGAPYHDRFRGRSYLYTGAGTSWSLQTTLDAPTKIDYGHFGSAIGLSDDLLLVGESGNTAAHVYTRSGSTWQLKASLGNAPDSNFGISAAVSNDTIFVGASFDQISGRAYIFEQNDLIFANGFN